VKKTLVLLLLVVAFASTSIAQKPQPAPTSPVVTRKAPVVPYVTRVLPNGLEIIVYPDSGVPLVTVEMAVRTGSFTEPPELNGLSHLFEHMIFKPNLARLAMQCDAAMKQGGLNEYGQRVCSVALNLKPEIGDTSYLSRIDKIGIANNAETHEEVVNYYFTTTAEHIATSMRFLRDSIRFPNFDQDELNGELQVVLAELDRHESEPGLALEKTMMEKLFYKYPSRKQPGGTRETVSTATIEKMQLIRSRYYIPNNSALIVSGAVDPENVFKMATEMFADWKRGPDPFAQFPIVKHPPLEKSEGIIVERPVSNLFVQVGWHGPSIGEDDASTYAADVFSYIVGQPDSRFQRAMIDSKLAVAATVHYYTQRNTGPIRITLVPTPGNEKAAIKKLYEEIAQFTDPKYFTDEELENAKTLLEAEDLYRREKLSTYSQTLSFWWSSTGTEYYRGYYNNLRAVSRKDINNYITRYIQNKPHIGIALLSPEYQQTVKLTPSDLIGGAK
jgi:zinc protease